MKFKESTLKLYAAPLSSTEDAKCKRAIEAIRDALKDLGYTDDQKDIGLLESDTLSYSIAMRNRYSTDKITIIDGTMLKGRYYTDRKTNGDIELIVKE